MTPELLLTIAAWVFGLAITAWLILGGIFLAYPTVHRLKDNHRDEITWRLKIPVYLWLFIGITADVIFNWTWGTVICRELPREFLFTDRLKRHWRGDDERMKRRIERWVKLVIMIDPGHV
jgi:hypothetical protein